MTPKKKLIEVALPLDAINKACAREKSIRHGHPSTLHLWWARRPLAAARAVIFAQMVDDPSGYVDVLRADPKLKRKAEGLLKARLKLWEEARTLADKAEGTGMPVPEPGPEPTLDEVLADQERQRLFRIIEDLVLWENTTNETVLQAARDEIWASWRRACAENADHPRAAELFDRHKLPAFHDPFAGGGALPLEAQRLGLESYASDLNPVAVLINKAMIEIPPRFAGLPPVNPESRKKWSGNSDALSGTDSLAKGDGSGEGGLSTGATAATRGNLRDEVPNHPGGGIGTSQHSGGLDPRVGPGEGSLSGHRAGIACRDGNIPDPVRGDRLVSDDRNGATQGTAHGSGENVDGAAPQLSEKLLTANSQQLFSRPWRGAQGLAEDVRYYGQWMRDEAEKRIGHLYPKVEVTAEMARERPDLLPYVGRQLTVIAWLWARTVKSPNPAFAQVDVPLASTFMLSTKAGKEAYVEPVIENGGYRFTVKVGKPKDAAAAKNGTKATGRGANFLCLMSGTPITGEYIRAKGMAGGIGARLMAVVAEGDRERVYLPPVAEHEIAAHCEPISDLPVQELPREGGGGRTNFWCVLYGLGRFADLFTPRQLVALTTFSDLVQEAMDRVKRDALVAGLPDDGKPLRDGGIGATAYAEAVSVYLGMSISKTSNRSSSLVTFKSGVQCPGDTFGRQALPMAWDYAESNVVSGPSGSFESMFSNTVAGLLSNDTTHDAFGEATQYDAAKQSISSHKVISTDPPYYDNIGYADLSDFFYVWLRRSLRQVYPDLFATLAVPKAEELVATPYRQGGKEKAEAFFLSGMTLAMQGLSTQAHTNFPVTIYYAFKQSESNDVEGTASTGWDTFLGAVIKAGFALTGTWPMRTERENRKINQGTNALASSIVLVCRKRPADAPTATRREFVNALKAELPAALAHLQRGNIAPVDLAQAAIGPGMAVYTRYTKVLDAEGKPLSVREALALINQTLDEALAEQEGDFDADSRWALTWFEQQGFAEGEFGVAEQLSKSKNTSVAGMVEAGILESKRGKVRLLPPDELPADWDPAKDGRLTAWESVHQLIQALGSGGESAAAALVAKLGVKAEVARELCYRLYTLCERKKRAEDALAYNGLVQSWPEIVRLARDVVARSPVQEELF